MTSLQLACVGLVFLHDLPDLLPFQRRVQHLVQPGIPLPVVDEVHKLIQGDERLPLGAAWSAEKRDGLSTTLLTYHTQIIIPTSLLLMCRIPFLKDALDLRPETQAVQKFLEGFPREIIWLESL